MAEEGEPRQKKRSRGAEGDATRVDVGEGARVMPGVGESYWNVAGVDRAVKIYNTGVVEGQLTLSRGNDWADTMANCEDAVASIAFWGQIATHLSSMEYRGAPVIGYFNKLFNLARQHFFPAGTALVGTGKARDFFVEQGKDGSPTSRWWFQLQRNVSRTCSENIVRVSSPCSFFVGLALCVETKCLWS